MTIAEQSPSLVDELLDRIDEVQAALRKAPNASLKAADCRLAGGRLVLSGSVPSFYLKQMTQSPILQVWDAPVLIDDQLEAEGTISVDSEFTGEEIVSSSN